MNNGTRVVISGTKSGCRGAEGKRGAITAEWHRHGLSRNWGHINVRLDDTGQVWCVNADAIKPENDEEALRMNNGNEVSGAKVTVTQAVADAIESALANQNGEKAMVVSRHTGFRWCAPEHQILNAISLDTLVRALYIGYDVEETAHDRIRDTYKRRLAEGTFAHIDRTLVSSRSLAFADGIKFALNELGVKIEGVNA
jgi:hypothetical protein